LNISSNSAHVPVDSSLKKEKIKQAMLDAKVAEVNQKPTAQNQAKTQTNTQSKDQAKLAALGKSGQAQASLSLAPDFYLKRTEGGAQVTGFPPGSPPAFESILREIYPDAQSIEPLSSDSTRPFTKAVFEVDGQSVEVSFLWGGFAPGTAVDVTPLEGDLPAFKESLEPPTNKKTPLSDPGTLFPKSAPITFDVKKSADGGFSVSGFPPGSPPPLKALLAEIFPDAKDIQILSESHNHPFDITQFQVDGKSYEYSFLFGGIVAGKSASIKPLD